MPQAIFYRRIENSAIKQKDEYNKKLKKIKNNSLQLIKLIYLM